MKRSGWWVVLVLVGALAGCGGSAVPDPDLVKRGEEGRALAVETFSLVGESVEVSSFAGDSGLARWAICGMEPSPSGVEYVAEAAITGSHPPSASADLIVSALKSAGWKVEPPTDEYINATRDGFVFTAQSGINLSIRSGCIDASGHVIDKLTDEPLDELDVRQPS